MCTPRFPSGSRLYSLSSGTSHAAPAVAGAAALIRDHHQRTRGSSPSPALTKAILINTASDLVGGANVSGNAPNHNQGWGLVNLASVFDATVRSHLDQSELLDESGDRFERSYTVSDTSQPVRITLVWTDPPGSTFGTSHVNNLDLEVELDGTTYRGNNLDDGVSEPDGTADPVDNVEAIVFPAGTDGSFDLDVNATNIAGDGVPGSSDEPTRTSPSWCPTPSRRPESWLAPELAPDCAVGERAVVDVDVEAGREGKDLVDQSRSGGHAARDRAG